MKAAGSHSQAGMTLLEMLVALTIFAMLMAALVQSEYLVLDSWQRGDEKVSRMKELDDCRRHMRRQVMSAVPFRPPSSWRSVPSFYGQSQEVTFVSSLAGPAGAPPGLWLVTYFWAPDESGVNGDLVVQLRPAFDAAYWSGEAAPVEGQSLLSGVERLQFTYVKYDWRRKNLEDVPFWQVAGGGRMPLAIKVEMVVDGETIRWELPLACGSR